MNYRSPRFKQVASTGALMLTAFIWGMCFVAQRSAMENIGPFLFNGIRELLGAATLLLVLVVIGVISQTRKKKSPFLQDQEALLSHEGDTESYGVIVEPGFKVKVDDVAKGAETRASFSLKYILTAGLLCGVVLFFASNLQQVGMVYVAASKAAFITTLYIVLVPILGLFIKHKTRWNTWVSVATAVVGLSLLCAGDSLVPELGDAILLTSAFFWAIHILVVGYFAPRLSMLRLFGMCVTQFAVAGVLSLIVAPFADPLFVSASITLESISNAWLEIAYAGILSTAAAFTLAAVGQRYAKPAAAAVIMSLESVFGLLGGILILGEVVTAGEAVGCVFMLAAVILTQLDFGTTKHNRARLNTS